MAGFAGMDEKCRGACAGQGRGYLAGDMTGFAHACNDDSAFTLEHDFAGLGEAVIDSVFEGAHRGEFGLDYGKPQLFKIRLCHNDQIQSNLELGEVEQNLVTGKTCQQNPAFNAVYTALSFESINHNDQCNGQDE